MKKTIFTLAIVAMSVVCNAQESVLATAYKYVSPISVSCMEFDVTAMRDSAINNEAYIAALTALQKQLNIEKEAIDAELKSLKSEKSLYDGEVGLCKDRKKQLEASQKNLQNDIKTYESHLKDIKKQYDIIKKIDDVSCDAIKEHTKRLAELEKIYKDEKEHMEKLLERISRNAENEINTNFAMTSEFLRELTDKETKLKNLQAQNKTNIELVKATLKTANGK